MILFSQREVPALENADITVDVVKTYLQKEIPGIMDMVRMKYGMEKPNALISRSVAGINGHTMIFTLPGSVKAVNEYMTEITKVLHHLVLMLYGNRRSLGKLLDSPGEKNQT